MRHHTLPASVLCFGLPWLACGGDTPLAPPVPPASALVASVISGDAQVGKAGELLPHALAVRVTDAKGAPVPGVDVGWTVTSGGGRLVDTTLRSIRSTRTTHDGEARAFLIPTRIGTTTVRAGITAGASGVTFAAEAVALVVDNHYWGYYMGPTESSTIEVPVGGTIEWRNRWWPVRIRSLDGPPGGAPFDSGIVPNGASFEFVPAVPGTWRWTYEYFDEDETPLGEPGYGILRAR